jgi:hypothetical protein
MSTSEPPMRPCPKCGARLLRKDSWCSLCYTPVEPPSGPAPAPAPASAPVPALPLQRRGPLSPGRRLVGGELPGDVLDRLTADLADELRGDVTARRVPRPGVLAVAGGLAVLAVLLMLMALLGLLL